MKLFLEDIQHSGRSGPSGVSREGEQYEERKNTYCDLEAESTDHGTVMIISHYLTPDMTGEPVLKTMTLPIEEIAMNYTHFTLKTVDTIYVFRKEDEQ